MKLQQTGKKYSQTASTLVDLPIALIRASSGDVCKKFVSLQVRNAVLISSDDEPSMFLLSSVRLTPPIVATSLMSSSSLSHDRFV